MEGSPSAADVSAGPDRDARLVSLVEAGITLSDDLSIDRVLPRIVEAAAGLTGARYAALGVVDDAGSRLERFVTHGIDEETRARIGPEPLGRGILGLLISDPRPLRLADIGAHPHAVGFPPGHPPMTSFLGVPVVIHGRVFGNLYLTDKAGGGEFSDEDEELVTLLARQAAVAIANSRMFHATRSWARQLEALGELTDSLLADTRGERLSRLIVRQFRILVGAEAAAMGMFDESGSYRVVAADGKGADYLLARSPGVPDHLIRGLEGGSALRVDSLADVPGVDPQVLAATELSAALLVPIMGAGRLVGVLAAADHVAGPHFGEADQRVAEVFAARASAVLELSRRVSRQSVRSIMEAQEQERRRVGRELHDHVGQELTAALLALKLIGADIRDGDHATALHEVAALRELLADTLQGVRALSSLLAPPAIDKHGFRGALERLARMLGERAGLEVRVEADAGADAMPEDLAAELYRIAQGGLTNVVRHAEARSVAVRVARTDAETLVMTVEDDGRGFDPDVPFGVGLEGASERVKLLGGEIHMEPRRGGGTVLRAELPWQD